MTKKTGIIWHLGIATRRWANNMFNCAYIVTGCFAQIISTQNASKKIWQFNFVTIL